jgi:post-segregation antitoxin (ccd killing protein)/ribosomal protein L32
MRVATMVTIDPELKKQAKKMAINISGALNEYLEILVNRQNQDLEGINIELERRNQEKYTQEMTNLQVKLNSTMANIEMWEAAKAKKEEERLQKEKETLESLKKCSICGKEIIGKPIHLGDDRLCKGCFMAK